MDRQVSTDASMLQLIQGQIYEVRPDGKRLPVYGYRD